jgi:NAD(P)-dependent dehydrogenase (short-subunit alcohol dehydrogenase family)
MRHQFHSLGFNTARELPGLKTGICDVGDRKQIENMVADAVSQLGGIDILVNNAGISGPTAPVEDVDPEQWDAVLKIDLTGTFLVTKNAIPHLVASRNGVIVIMSSAAGRFGYPNRSPYSTVKWGLIGFMKTLSMELGVHNIRANAILPGAVNGDRIQRVFEGRAKATGRSLDAVKAEAMANQSLKSLVDPKDIAALAVFLASDAAKSISMFISLFPNWIGQTQPRVVRIEGDRLFLSTAQPISSSGKTVNSHLVWRHADASTMTLK